MKQAVELKKEFRVLSFVFIFYSKPIDILEHNIYTQLQNIWTCLYPTEA